MSWRASKPIDVIMPEMAYEGAGFPRADPEGATGANRPKRLCYLRDPFLFEDTDGKLYLYYTGGDESAICLAEIEIHFTDGTKIGSVATIEK